jgi:hypothetical protein
MVSISYGGSGGRDVDDAVPHPVEAQEELDFFRAAESSMDFPEVLAAGVFAKASPAKGAEERILTPVAEDEVAPERPQVAGALRGGSGR